MKFFTLVSLAATAAAQQVWIQAPGNNQEVIAGKDLVIEVQSEDSASPYQDIAAVIGIAPWSSNPCCGELGEYLLYQGNWSIDGFAYPQGGLYTNVTVTIPSDLPLGNALLSVGVFQVYSNENAPDISTATTNVTVISSS